MTTKNEAGVSNTAPKHNNLSTMEVQLVGKHIGVYSTVTENTRKGQRSFLRLRLCNIELRGGMATRDGTFVRLPGLTDDEFKLFRASLEDKLSARKAEREAKAREVREKSVYEPGRNERAVIKRLRAMGWTVHTNDQD